MNFYLQYGIKSAEGYPEPRLFIDETLHPDCNLLKTMECEDWLTARAECGPLVIADAMDYVAKDQAAEAALQVNLDAEFVAFMAQSGVVHPEQFVEIGQAA